MASPTQNYSSAYDVFLNHRGLDTKKGFAGHLYHRIRSQGIRVFLDKYELPVGNELTHEITAAIKTASVHVAIFSKNYAESYWCLKELVLMLESIDSGATVIPIFYDVKPSSLRWKQGEDCTASQTQETQQGQGQITEPTQTRNTYAEQLQKLKNKRNEAGERRYDENTIAKWRAALKSAADLKGLELDEFKGYEGELVEKIVERVSEMVIKTPYNVPKYDNIGLDVKVKGFKDKVLPQQQKNGKPHVVGIVGSGGVGKKTLAKEFFHENSPAYRNSCFFPVRQIARRTLFGSLRGELFVRLSRTNVLLNSALENVINVYNPPLDRVKHHPSLVILDGVDNVEDGNELLSIQRVLHSESLILITSRHRDVLTLSGVEDALIYKLNGLDAPWSGKLFCLHAFHQAAPYQGYEYLVGGFVGLCNGLPLLLKVFGAFLYGKNERSYWEELLDRLQHQIDPHAIEKKLKLIYDRLDIKQQLLFLYIASFFIERSTDTTLAIWKGPEWKGSLWLQTLVEKRLVEVDSKNCIKMHDEIEDLVKNIAEERKEPLSLWPKTNNYAELLHESPVITEPRRNIDYLSRQSYMILTTVMMMMAMKIWNMRRRR